MATRPADARRAMLEFKPNIVHFCGHGAGEKGIVFEDDLGNAKLVDGETLAEFFQLFSDSVECIVLNACYSATQAEAIVRVINYVVGMRKGISDAAALEYAVAFYDAVANGETIEFSHKVGCNAIRMEGFPEHLTPVIKSKGQLIQEMLNEKPITHRSIDEQPSENTLSEKLQERVLKYQEAIAELKEILPSEQLGIVESALDRLKKLNVNIAVFGETNSGKSSLLNALFGRNNDLPSEWLFTVDGGPNTWSQEATISNGKVWTNQGDVTVTLYDTPGIAGDIEDHFDTAMKIANGADLIIYVVFEPVKSELQVPVMRMLIDTNKPLVVAINKVDMRRRREIDAIRADILSKFEITEANIVECAGHPRDGMPQITTLVSKILGIIDAYQGKLIDDTVQQKLNIAFQAASDILIQKAEEQERYLEEQATQTRKEYKDTKEEHLVLNHLIIHTSSVIAATTAAALAQAPGADEGVLTVITVTMIGTLCSSYGQFNLGLVGAYLGVVSGGLLGKMGAAYLYKWVPFLGNAINAGVTFALHESQGWLIVSLLEKGLYTTEQIKQVSLQELKKEAERRKEAARNLVGTMDPETLRELKAKAARLQEEAKQATKEFKR